MTSQEAIATAHAQMQQQCTSELRCVCTVEMISAARKIYWEISNEDKNNWMLAKMHMLATPARREVLRIPLGNAFFCASCFRLVLGINRKKWFKLRRMAKQGIVSFVRDNAVPTPRHKANTAVIQWLDYYVKMVGQFMPHVDEVHLPPGKWYHVYDLMVADIKQATGNEHSVCTFSYFSRLQKENYSHVKVPAEQRFTKCKICTGLKAARRRTLIRAELKDIKLRREKHLQQVMTERRKYWSRRTKAKQYPHQYLSMILDGMDQHKTLLPRFMEQSSAMSACLRLKAHLVGVMVHGRGNYIYISNDRVHSDPNLTVHCVFRTLLQLPPPLPPVLYLQADNCFRENKNKFVFAFLAMLVEAKVFTKVYWYNLYCLILKSPQVVLSFLPVGHTHEDIDQMFSRVSLGLSSANTETVRDLCTKLPTLFTPVPVVEEVHGTANFRAWVEDHIMSLKGHAKPHSFKFSLGADQKLVIQSKHWSRRHNWLPEEGMEFLKVNSVLNDIPGEPTMTPMVEYDLGELTRSIRRLAPLFLRPTAEQEWAEWIQAQLDFDEMEPVRRWREFVTMLRQPRIAEPEAKEPDLGSESETDNPLYVGTRTTLPEHMELKIEEGKLVAIRTDIGIAPFEVGRVLEVLEDGQVAVHWYGTRTRSGGGKWWPLQKAGTTEDYTDVVCKESILWGNFELYETSGRIPKSIRDIIMRRKSAPPLEVGEEENDA